MPISEQDESLSGAEASLGRVRFWLGDALIDPDMLQVIVGDKTTTLNHRTIAVLVYLAEHGAGGRLVTTDQLIEEFWPTSSTGDNLLKQNISHARGALGCAGAPSSDSDSPIYIQTVHGLGYRLQVGVTRDEQPAAPPLSPDDATHHARPLSAVDAARHARPLPWLVVAAVLILGIVGVTQLWPPGSELFGTPYSIAVLAFDDDNAPEELAGIGKLIAEDLILTLSSLQRFDLVSPRTTFLESYEDMELREMGKTLDVRYVLDGSVASHDGELQLRVFLTQTDNHRIPWKNVLLYQSDEMAVAATQISKEVANALQIVLETREQEILEAQRVRDPEAYRNYLLAGQRMRGSRDANKLNQAIDLFSEAVRLDENYAAAKVGLCKAHVALYGIEQVPDQFERANSTCNDVVQLQSFEAQGQIALATLFRERGDYATAARMLKAVVDAFPRDTDALVELGDTYVDDQKFEAARTIYQQAVGVAPNEYDTQAALGIFLADRGEFEPALEHLMRSTFLNPRSPRP